MKPFIKLHRENDNSIVILATNSIILIELSNSDGKKYSLVQSQISGGGNLVTCVNETPEKIYNLLEQ